MVGLRIGLGLGVRVRVRRPDSSGNLLLRRKLHYAPGFVTATFYVFTIIACLQLISVKLKCNSANQYNISANDTDCYMNHLINLHFYHIATL